MVDRLLCTIVFISHALYRRFLFFVFIFCSWFHGLDTRVIVPTQTTTDDARYGTATAESGWYLPADDR